MNLGELASYVQNTAGYWNSRISSAFASEVSTKCNDICRGFDFWFLNVVPDPLFFTNFPITDITTLIKSDPWLARGWFYLGSESSVDKVFLFKTSFDGGTTWVNDMVARGLTCNRYTLEGVPDGTLEYIPYEELLTMVNSDSSIAGEPLYYSVISQGNLHYLMLYPFQDMTQEKIYSISYKQSEQPALSETTDTNSILTYYPDIAKCIGMLIVFDHFHDKEKHQEYLIKLFGYPEEKGNGGMVRLMKNDNRTRNRERISVMVPYPSAKAAGHGNRSRLHPAEGGGWWRP